MTLIKSISGIRGTIGGKAGDTLNPLDIVKFTSAYATFIRRNSKTSANLIVVGRDARISGGMVRKVVCGTLLGMGFDVHRLVEGRELWLGGIRLEHSRGLLGHSDADVLIHAICDALLGAANMRDIGYHFPDTGEEYRNIDSKILLRKTVALISTKGYRVGNIDATVCAEQPKLQPHIPAMQACLAEVMGIDEDCVSIKATTTERLGFTGREEGISAYATVLIMK